MSELLASRGVVVVVVVMVNVNITWRGGRDGSRTTKHEAPK